jgi:CO dehydrogenase nickel-insertion accessory protein CooC1
VIEKSEYKGKPIIVIKRDENDKFPFSFGVAKARLIMENLEEIKKFIEENDKK